MSDDEAGERLRDRPAAPGTAPVIAPALWALVVVTGVGPFAVDTYLGALPDVSRDLDVTAAVAQLSVTLFIVGVATGQLVFGPVSDGRGRRPLLLGGTLVFTVATLACAVATSGAMLIGARLVEGLAAGCCVAVGRATIGDSAIGVDAARRIGTLAAITFLAPVVAPSVGGLILLGGTWRTVFLVSAPLGWS